MGFVQECGIGTSSELLEWKGIIAYRLLVKTNLKDLNVKNKMMYLNITYC